MLYSHKHLNHNSKTNTYSGKNRQIQIQHIGGDSLLFRYECFINFWLRLFDTRRETQFLKVFRNHTMLTPPPTFSTSCGPVSTSPHHGRTPTSPHHGRNSTKSFSKSSKFSGPSLPGMTSYTLQPYFLSGVYHDKCDCHILCAQA